MSDGRFLGSWDDFLPADAPVEVTLTVVEWSEVLLGLKLLRIRRDRIGWPDGHPKEALRSIEQRIRAARTKS